MKNTKVCANPRCVYEGTPQLLSEFYENVRSKGGYTARCKTCLRAEARARINAHPERRLKWKEAHPEYDREWRNAHKEQERERMRQWNKEHPEYRRDYQRKYNAEHAEEVANNQKKRHQQLRLDVMLHYGGAVCVCCGETDIRFLTLDHINNDGAQHRQRSGSGINLYCWLKKNNYPECIQVLCYNCNCARAHNNGVCPHKDPIVEGDSI